MTGINIRKITTDDTDLVVKWRNTQHVREHFIYRKEFDRATHENWLKNVISEGKAVQFIIYETEDGFPIGSVYFTKINNSEHRSEFGIFIGEAEAAGRGYGTEAAGMALAYAFEHMKMESIYLRVFTDNISAIKSYEKTGFVRYDVLHDVMCTDGEKKDMYLMKISKEEYQGKELC